MSHTRKTAAMRCWEYEHNISLEAFLTNWYSQGGNTTDAARAMGVPLITLNSWQRRLGMTLKRVPEFASSLELSAAKS